MPIQKMNVELSPEEIRERCFPVSGATTVKRY